MTYPIHTGPESLPQLQAFVANPAFSRFVVLADENTAHQCYPKLAPYLPEHKLLTIGAGEHHKNLETCTVIWQQLTELHADRWALLINLGGGVIGDLGGFCAATYKRGIRFVQVPTSLLAQVDASVGGKVGIDFSGFKNQIGVFQDPAGVFVYPDFLSTLPVDELKSGYAEVIKHCLVADAARFETERKIGLFTDNWSALIEHSLEIKSAIVAADPLESGYRKVLNFGHTIGHALESYFLTHRPQPLLHGFAVAAGMVCEAYISQQRGLLQERELEKIILFIFSIYERPQIGLQELASISELALQDKKGAAGTIRCTLLEGIGKAIIDQPVSVEEIRSALQFYTQL